MLRSLHMKLVMIMVLLILSLMLVVGAFLVNSVTAFYLEDFYTQVSEVFSDPQLVHDLETEQEGEEDGAAQLREVLSSVAGELGVDGRNRKLYILNGNGECLISPTGTTPPWSTPRTCSLPSPRGWRPDRRGMRATPLWTIWTWPSPSSGGARTM